MSNIEVRTAAQQCAEYVSRERLRERRAVADRAIRIHMRSMQERFGSEVTVTALVKYVGTVLVAGARNGLIQQSCRFLAKCIARSVVRRLLTKPPMLH
jgi:hypothetical protein